MPPHPDKPLRFLHIGDLHITEPGLRNHLDFGRIVDETNANLAGRIDFAILPGDIADDGASEQFKLVSRDLGRLETPWHAIPGDHDYKPGSLDNFYNDLGGRGLPYAEDISGCRCIFLDVVSRGTGGPDFRLSAAHMGWLRAEIGRARDDDKMAVVFMHTYPADLKDHADELAALFDHSTVALVDMGHTHYNELSNDGRTIYAATRSTGQIEEGDVGFALAAIDRGAVSWRFKPLDSPWPFVMITKPADRRLMIDSPSPRGEGRAAFTIRAAAWGAAAISEAEFRIDDGGWLPMQREDDGLFIASPALPDRTIALSVRVTDAHGQADTDTIEVAPRDGAARASTGSDAGSIGAWPARHLFGTQLGPNRNGRKW